MRIINNNSRSVWLRVYHRPGAVWWDQVRNICSRHIDLISKASSFPTLDCWHPKGFQLSIFKLLSYAYCVYDTRKDDPARTGFQCSQDQGSYVAVTQLCCCVVTEMYMGGRLQRRGGKRKTLLKAGGLERWGQQKNTVNRDNGFLTVWLFKAS